MKAGGKGHKGEEGVPLPKTASLTTLQPPPLPRPKWVVEVGYKLLKGKKLSFGGKFPTGLYIYEELVLFLCTCI